MRRIIAVGLAAAGLLLAGCSSAVPAPSADGSSANGSSAGGSSANGSGQGHTTGSPVGPPGAQSAGVLRLGLAENVADAPALAGWQMGFLGQNLGKTTLEPAPFTSAAAELAALENGQLDAAYLDPIAALQAWQSAPGGLIKIIAGAASGGAELVVTPHITSPAQLKGHTLAAPANGAQQAAADHWLAQHGLPARTTAQASTSAAAGLLQQFRTGKIAGAWEPPPLDVQLTAAGGHVLVDENTLWPGGQFPTAILVVTQKYLSGNPAAVSGLLKGQLQALRFLTADQVSAQAAIGQRLTAIGRTVTKAVLARSFTQVAFTDNPLPAALLAEAQNAAAAGLLKPVKNLASIYDLNPLNQALKADGQKPILTARPG
jgi:NitT/TauT family transport system substrate-binding protein